MRASAMVQDVTIRAQSVGVAETAAAADKLGQAVDGAATASDNFSRSSLSVDRALDRVRRQIDESYRQTKQFEAGQRTLDRALEASRITSAEYERDLALLGARFGVAASGTDAMAKAAEDSGRRFTVAAQANDNFKRATEATTKSSGLARHELINLSRQAQDVGTMFALGAPPMQIFASQASQIFDIFSSSQGTLTGFFGQVARGAAGLVTSAAGIVTGLAAIGGIAAYSAYSYAASQKTVENALRGVGAASGASLAGINRFADAEARSGKISAASAREIAAAFASTGRVDPTKLPGLGNFTREYSAFTGADMSDATQDLAKAFADPSKGAEDLAGKLGGLNSAALRWIQSQQAAGNLLGAQRSLLETFQQQVQGSTEHVGLFARAWDGLKSSVSAADEALGRTLNGPTDAERLAALLQQRERLQASAGPGSIGVNNQLRLLEAQIRPLEAIVELERQRQAIDDRAAKAGAASLAASAISDQIEPFRKQMEDLVALQSKLTEAQKLSPFAPEYDEWGKALDRVNGAIKTMLPSSERERQSHELTMRAINARTVAERAAIEVARETLRLSGEKVSAAEREIAAQRKAAEVQQQANRDAQDALKASRDQLALSGLRPGERFQVEQAQRLRDNTEKFGGYGSISRDALLDAIERTESRGRNVPNYRYDSTHTAQGYFQITNETWRDIAKAAGIDLSQYPNAMSAPYADQRRAANALIDQRGVQPWAPHNPALRNWLGSNGGDPTALAINDNFAHGRERDLHQSVIGGSEDELKRQTAALEIQRQAFGKSTEELARQNAEQDLFNKLIAAGGEDLVGKFTPEIQQLAQRYGELARQQEELQRMQETLRSIGDIGKDALKGFISDLRSGKSAGEALQNVLDRVTDKLLDLAINDMFPKTLGGTGGGFFGSLFKLIGGGVSATPTVSSGTGGLYANGGLFGPFGVHPFALGGAFSNGIVSRPTLFPFANGIGLMGEAGEEAIMPLRRGRDGRLGVSAAVASAQAAANSNAAPQVSFNLINQGRPVEIESTRETSDGNGGRRVDIVMKEVVGKAIQEPGAARDALQNSYGARQRVSRR